VRVFLQSVAEVTGIACCDTNMCNKLLPHQHLSSTRIRSVTTSVQNSSFQVVQVAAQVVCACVHCIVAVVKTVSKAQVGTYSHEVLVLCRISLYTIDGSMMFASTHVKYTDTIVLLPVTQIHLYIIALHTTIRVYVCQHSCGITSVWYF
jgi:hypothetical protein